MRYAQMNAKPITKSENSASGSRALLNDVLILEIQLI